MTLPSGNPRPPEGINATGASGLGEFILLGTGLTVLVIVLAVGFSLAAGWLAPLIPFSWEQVVAKPYSSEVTSPYPNVRTELQSLAERLVAHGALPPNMTIHVHLSDSGRANAFATLGGNIIITRGMLQQVSSENALSMVLAHEIGHVKHRDALRALSSIATFQLIWVALTGSAGPSAASRILGSAGLMTQLKFSRDMETAADRFALMVLKRTYGHDCGAGEFFREYDPQHEQPTWTLFARTHPLTRNRIAAIDTVTARHDPVRLTPPTPAIAKLAGAPEQPPMGCVDD